MLLVDDDPMARTGVSMILNSVDDITVVDEATDGDQAVTLVHQHAPDIVLMDVRMPRMDGIRATAEVVAAPRSPKVIVLTTFDFDQYAFDALAAGAAGFLLKEESPQDIINAVRVVARGDAMLSPRMTKSLIAHFALGAANANRARAREGLGALTEREREIVTAVAQGKSNAHIGNELHLSEATVKTHITRCFHKLDVGNRVQLTIFAYEAGLVTP
ncbi:two component transcriptional regulator, LuxR family [Haloechinothrix alba]|uniref:Two component transcriptional regulator, LuxR family n=1 Tax=Haloechinothrix alba TaxID=664784 RepID=A0A238X1A6_9PSEU|nr:response regulator transcription factor [Haloechinothrix alba]SNR52696.1 two component transcriptional regulator, LuxR family [Haloechinothrix alba]